MIDSPASSRAAAAALSSAASAALSSLTLSPSRGPSVLKFGTSSNWITSLSSSAVSISSTLSSSATMSTRISGDPAGRNTSARDRGWRTFTDASLRAARPSEVRRRANAICASRSRSMRVRSATGQSARWTDSSSAAAVSWRHMASATKGQKGASRSATVRQHLVQGGLGGQGVARGRIGIGAPEPPATAAHVPVGEVVDQIDPGRWPRCSGS